METEISIVFGGLPSGADMPAILRTVREFSSAGGVEVQLFDAAAVVGSDHLRSAALHALRAKERRVMRTASLGMEMMLYAAGRRQIREATARVGLRDSTQRIAAVLVGPRAAEKGGGLLEALGAVPLGESQAAGGTRALERLGIPAGASSGRRPAELALELVALLDVER